jgi:hypothetical protein
VFQARYGLSEDSSVSLVRGRHGLFRRGSHCTDFATKYYSYLILSKSLFLMSSVGGKRVFWG